MWARHQVVIDIGQLRHPLVDNAGHIIVYLLFTSFYVPRHEPKEG